MRNEMRVHIVMWWALKKVARSLRVESHTAAVAFLTLIWSVAGALVHCAGLVIAPLLAPFMQLWRRYEDRRKFRKLLGIARGWGSNRSLMAAMLEQRLQLFPNDRPYRVLLAVIQHKDRLRRRIQLARLRGEHEWRRPVVVTENGTPRSRISVEDLAEHAQGGQEGQS